MREKKPILEEVKDLYRGREKRWKLRGVWQEVVDEVFLFHRFLAIDLNPSDIRRLKERTVRDTFVIWDVFFDTADQQD